MFAEDILESKPNHSILTTSALCADGPLTKLALRADDLFSNLAYCTDAALTVRSPILDIGTSALVP